MEAADLAFWSEEELLALLKSSSFTELYAILQSLEELYKGQKMLPAHVQMVQKYVANQFDNVREQIDEFTAKTGYVAGRTLSVHGLFGNLTLTLYPVEGKNPKAENKAAHTPHRPILDIELVGRTPYARCYLGLYATAPDSRFKDVTANEQGEITLKDIGLMNLGNPFKALLWCEDYLSSQEHYTNKDDKPRPRQSFARSWCRCRTRRDCCSATANLPARDPLTRIAVQANSATSATKTFIPRSFTRSLGRSSRSFTTPRTIRKRVVRGRRNSVLSICRST